MTTAPAPSSSTPGILLALGGAITLSMNDLAIKALADTGYALHQVILIRALIGMALVLAVMAVSPGGLGQVFTRRRARICSGCRS